MATPTCVEVRDAGGKDLLLRLNDIVFISANSTAVGSDYTITLSNNKTQPIHADTYTLLRGILTSASFRFGSGAKKKR